MPRRLYPCQIRVRQIYRNFLKCLPGGEKLADSFGKLAAYSNPSLFINADPGFAPVERIVCQTNASNLDRLIADRGFNFFSFKSSKYHTRDRAGAHLVQKFTRVAIGDSQYPNRSLSHLRDGVVLRVVSQHLKHQLALSFKEHADQEHRRIWLKNEVSPCKG